MTRYITGFGGVAGFAGFAVLWVSACASEPVATGSQQQGLMQQQGTQLQGVQLQGSTVQGLTLRGFQFAGATLGGAALDNVRIEKGELVAEQNQITLRGTALVNAHVFAQVQNLAVTPPTTSLVEYQITAIEQEAAAYDRTPTGGTFLYTLAQNVDNTGSWQLACGADDDGKNAAIPLAATWNSHGDRVESSSLFTFGCTTGVIAKCYRWGYRPWATGYGDLVSAHWTCTRVARADYCGNGISHTRDGTVINVWDNLGGAGPIQSHGPALNGMVFEAGWNTGGAVCFSHARWLLGGPIIALGCPNRLLAPGVGLLGGTVCDDVAHVLGLASDAQMFDESNLNLNLDLF
jgi:hypothetical protein